MVKDFLYEKESYLIIDAAKEVWQQLGGGFKEKIADRAFTIALKDKELKVENQKRIKVYFKEELVGVYVPDIVINDCILIEIKSKPYIHADDVKQLWHYLKSTKYKLGFIINFSPKGVQYKRVVYDKARK